MSEIIKPLFLDETGKAIVEALTQREMTKTRIAEINAAADAAKSGIETKTDEQVSRITEVTALAEDVNQLKADLDDHEEQIGWVENNPPLPTNQWKWYNATFSDVGVYIESSKFIQMPEWENNYIVDKTLKFLVNDGYIFNVFIFNKKGAFNVYNFVGKLKENFDSNEVIIDYKKYKNCYYSVVLSKEDGTNISTSECVNVIAYCKSKIDLPYVTPEMFGAKGDGVTNDSVALRLALNSGKKLIIPQKTYAFDYIKLPNLCEIEGCGEKSVLLNSFETTEDASISLSSVENIRVHLKNFKLIGNYNTLDGIKIDNTDGPSNKDDHWHYIDGLHVEGFKNGISMFKTRECRTVNCTIRNCVRGFYYDSCSDGSITMCTASQNTKNGFHITQGSNYRVINNKAFMNDIGFYINEHIEFSNVIISCCEEQDNISHGYYLETSKNISISDCLGGGTPNAITIDGITGLSVSGHFMIRGTGHKVLNTIGPLKNAKIEIFTNNLVNEILLYNFSEIPINTKLIIDMVEQSIN